MTPNVQQSDTHLPTFYIFIIYFKYIILGKKFGKVKHLKLMKVV